MYSPAHLALKYFRYYFTASNGKGHGTHSPFVFQFITKVLNDKVAYPDYLIVEKMRQTLLRDQSVLTIEDLGAGSGVSNNKHRSIAAIAKAAAKPPKYGQLLYRMVKYYQPGSILELGTSLGITTSYLALANPSTQVVTMEGAPSIARQARRNFETAGLTNITVSEGNFDDLLPAWLKAGGPSPGLCFIDGNHRYEPTLRYFDLLLNKAENDTIIIFDDIHWSAEMERAWSEICAHDAVTTSIDLFFIGIVFLRREFKQKQDFRIRF